MKNLVHLRTIEDFSTQHLRELFESLQETGFDSSRGIGFITPALEQLYLSAVFVLRRNVYRTIFDPETKSFSKQESYYFEEIPFAIDGQFNTLEIYSNLTNTHHLITRIGQLTKFQFPIADLQIMPAVVLDLFIEAAVDFKLTKFSIKNFVVKSGISGNYTATVDSRENAFDLIQQQKTDVTRISLVADFVTEKDVKLTVTQNGGFHISCQEDNLFELLREIKSVLMALLKKGQKRVT